MDPIEVSFQIPLGTIAAKVWGPEDGRPVLAMHGWQDNCGTFDKLIPLLSEKLRIVAFDFLGHGYSSHKGPGQTYRWSDHIWEARYVIQCLKWNKFTILAHSMGACIGLMYASIFPEEVIQVVSLDLVKPPTGTLSQLRQQTRRLFELHWDIEEKLKQKTPIYPEAEALLRIVQGSYGSINEESAAILMKRGAKYVDTEKNVAFTRDLRLKCSFVPKLDLDTYKAYLTNIKTELLIIKAVSSHISDPPEIVDELKSSFDSKCSYFEYVEVHGTHHVHLNNPERVVDFVNSFLSRYAVGNESKL